MPCKYPIVLVHGIAMKDWKRLRAFGKIEKNIEAAGYEVHSADIDGFGTIETNAQQLRDYILNICEQTGKEKVNIIAHSKGGLDSKYMITKLGMEDKVASLTTLCTPHKGSIIASKIWSFPGFVKKFIAFWINLFYRILGDKHPNALGACEQLMKVEEEEETINFSDKVYCQSFSTSIKKFSDCFIFAIPMRIIRRYDDDIDNDGMVCVESAKFGNYRGECIHDMPLSHGQIIDFMAKKNQKEKIYDFYCNLCREISDIGF